MKVKRVNENAIVPTRGSEHAAGLDLYNPIGNDVTIQPFTSRLIDLQIQVAIPHGYYGRMASRSGLAVKKNLEVGAGVVDSDYRGNLMALLRNHGAESVSLKGGDRIAQLIITPHHTLIAEDVASLDDTKRGDGKFGSTGE